MAAPVNAGQRDLWNGQEGRRWADHHQRLDRMAAPFNEPLFAAARIAESDQVLDIGCGTGETTRVSARLAARGHAVGIDLSAPMLELARRVAAEQAIGNITFEQGDAQLHPLPSGRFDVAISRAGVMFFDDPVAAFTNIGRALRPGGRLAFACHGGADTGTADILGALAPHLPALEPRGRMRGAGDFTDRDHISAVLDRAGFTAVTISALKYRTELGHDAADAAHFLLGVQLAGLVSGTAEAALRRARSALEAILRPYESDGAVRLPGSAWIVTARTG
jgi:SAM-dependent methyltransferase